MASFVYPGEIPEYGPSMDEDFQALFYREFPQGVPIDNDLAEIILNPADPLTDLQNVAYTADL